MAAEAMDRRCCFLKDQEPLSAEAYERTVPLREAIRRLLDGRESFIASTGLDPAIHLPMANWRLNSPVHVTSRTVLAGDYSVINNLRLFTQIYSGHQLLSLSARTGLQIPRQMPADVDAKLADMMAAGHAELQADVARYVTTVRYLPEILHITPPRTMGEVGWFVNGKIVNHDTDAYLERVVLLAESGKLWELRNRSADRPLILEIGGGFGGLAYHLKKLIPNARYLIVDIPESLLISSLYLTTLFSDEDNVLITPDNLERLRDDRAGFSFVPNYLFDECLRAGLRPDLVINTLSMSEMNEQQVGYYATGIAKLLGERGVFFEQNRDTRFRGDLDAKRVIRNFLPYCLPLSCPYRPLHQGDAHLWATTPVAPYKWQPSRRLKFPPHPQDPTWTRSLKRIGKKLLLRR